MTTATLTHAPVRSAPTHVLRDSATMLRRSLLHMRRYPSLTLMLVGMPVVFLLLFVYVFGGTLGAGLGGPSTGRAGYINFVTPGILLIAIAAAAQGTSITVAMDMTEGIVDRFRTMSISRAAVLTGHVLGAMIQTAISLVVVLAIALAIGFRSSATVLEWVLTAGLLLLVSLAMTWLCVALGMITKSVETASNLPMPLLLLPFFGSAFVPTDSMPVGLRWFAEYQPFTPIIDTVRGLLLGGPIGSSAVQAVAWLVVITLASYVWALRLFSRERSS